jgi:uncharacterized protein YpmS
MHYIKIIIKPLKILPAVLILVSFTFSSCGQKENKTPEPGTTTENKNQQAANTTEQAKENKASENPETEKREKPKDIRVEFPVGSTQVTLNGNIKGFGQNIPYVFEVSKGQKLNASVKPKTGEGNIRIGQIIDPSGKADGPFGDQMTYKLNQSGDWKLIINENMMSGEPWTGEYFLTIEIK